MRLLSTVVAAACSILMFVVPEGTFAPSSAAGAAGMAMWTARAVPRGVDTLNDVVCPSAAHCYAIGGDGTTGPGSIIGSADGGDRWRSLMTAPNCVLVVST